LESKEKDLLIAAAEIICISSSLRLYLVCMNFNYESVAVSYIFLSLTNPKHVFQRLTTTDGSQAWEQIIKGQGQDPL